MRDPYQAFLDEVGDEPLYSPIPNFGPFLVGSRFNTKQYFDPYYDTVKGGPLLLVSKHGQHVGWMTEKITVGPSKEFLQKNLSDITETRQRLAHFESIRQNLHAEYQRNTRSELQKHSIANLQTYLDDIFDRLWDTNTCCFFSFFLDKEICQQALANTTLPIDLNAIWQSATESSTPSFEAVDHMDLVGKRLINTPDKALLEYAEYTTCSFIAPSPLADVQTQITPLLNTPLTDLHRQQQDHQRKWQTKQDDFKRWQATRNPNEARLIEYLQSIIYLRDARKHLIRQGLTLVWRIGEILTQPLGLDRNDLIFLTRDEITGSLPSLAANRELIRARQNGCLTHISTDGQVILTNTTNTDAVQQALEHLYFDTKQTTGEILHGQPASHGSITAHARIILYPHEFATFAAGDILVTSMTRPEFVPLMKKASAIITDEGGITCHAAIVSRELGIPCVIGTKIATRWIPDHSLVTVDGKQGTITKHNQDLHA